MKARSPHSTGPQSPEQPAGALQAPLLNEDSIEVAEHRALESPDILPGSVRARLGEKYFSPPIVRGVSLAAVSAISFGITTPLVARAGHGLKPFETAALLYAGATAAALGASFVYTQSGRPLSRQSVPWLLLVGALGGALAPSLFTWGLARTSPTTSSLALNLEAVFTVVLARIAFGEPIGRRVWAAVSIMALGGALVSADAAREASSSVWGLAAVIAATAVWAADNAFTRPLSEEKPLHVVAAKSALGGSVTGLLAWACHEPSPELAQAAALLACGAVGYGLSLHFYLLAQRSIGAARTGSIFAMGPFVGAALAWALGDRSAGWLAVAGAAAFVAGVYLHVTERHGHLHCHPEQEHEHAHRHDEGHHTHEHNPPVVGEHTHAHTHESIEHSHEHAPDIHHSHDH